MLFRFSVCGAAHVPLYAQHIHIICVGVKRMHQFMREGLGPTLWLLLDEHGIAESCQRYAA